MTVKKLLDFIETLPIGDGDLLGEPYKLLDYQRRFLRGAFSEGVIRAGLTLGRGGGKSGLASALALAAILPNSPLYRAGFECLCFASSFSQACIIGRSVKVSLELMGKSAQYRIRDSHHNFEITHHTGANFRCYGSDPKRAHGLRPNLILADEPSQWESGGERLAAALRTALGKRKGSRLLAIGTRPENEDHWFERLLTDPDKSVFSQVYAASRDDNPYLLSTWRKANPALNKGFPLREVLEAEARLAKTTPQEESTFKALRLNMGTREIQQAALLSPEAWAALEVDILPPRAGRFALGIDLGGVAAFSAAAAFWPQSGRLEGFVATGSLPSLEKRAETDRVPGVYERMKKAGELVLLGNRVVPVGDFMAEAIKRFGVPSKIAADRWRSGELEDGVTGAGLRLPEPTWRGQGWRDGGQDTRLFQKAAADKKIAVKKSLAFRASMTEARLVTDLARNQKLAKGSEAGRRQGGRDDLAAAMILAIAEGSRMDERPAPRLRYVSVG